MLVLNRRAGEAIRIGHHGEITVTVVEIGENSVRLGFDTTSASVPVHREEVFQKIHARKRS